MICNYGGRKERDIQFDSVIVNGVEYIVPSTVANAIDSYAERLIDEHRRHEAEMQKYEELNNEKYEAVAERIMFALEEGANRESLLKYSINYHEKTDSSGQPIFEKRHELRRRIIMALKGLTPNGEPYK